MSINLTDPTIEVVIPGPKDQLANDPIPNKSFYLDLVQAHMFLERYAKGSELSKDDETEEVPAFVRAFQAYIEQHHQAKLTIGQVWKLTNVVGIEFIKLKKNYDQELSVVMNSEPTPSLSLKDKSISSPNQTQRVFRSSPDLEPNENLLTEE